MPINEEFDRLRPLKIIFLVEFVKGYWMRGVIMTIDHEISLRVGFSFASFKLLSSLEAPVMVVLTVILSDQR